MHNDFKWNYMVFPRDSTIALVFHAKISLHTRRYWPKGQPTLLAHTIGSTYYGVMVMVDPNHYCGFAASFLHYTLMSHLIPWKVNVNYYLFWMVEFRI